MQKAIIECKNVVKSRFGLHISYWGMTVDDCLQKTTDGDDQMEAFVVCFLFFSFNFFSPTLDYVIFSFLRVAFSFIRMFSLTHSFYNCSSFAQILVSRKLSFASCHSCQSFQFCSILFLTLIEITDKGQYCNALVSLFSFVVVYFVDFIYIFSNTIYLSFSRNYSGIGIQNVYLR